MFAITRIVIVAILASTGILLATSQAQAEEFDDFKTSILKPVSCDQRAAKVKVAVPAGASKLGIGSAAGTNAPLWLAGGGITAGNHNYLFPSQRYGTTKRWVVVIETTTGTWLRKTLKPFIRPPRSECDITAVNRRLAGADYDPSVDVVCDDDHVKMVVVRAVVTGQGHLPSAGVGEIVRTNDREVITAGVTSQPLQKEAYWYFPLPPAAGIKHDPKENSVNYTTSSSWVVVDVSVRGLCQLE